MFFVVNKTKKNITLGDIGVTLGPRQAVDLDKVMSRGKSENSRALKSAMSNGDIEIRVKDKKESTAIPNFTTEKSLNDLGKMKKEIVGEITGVMKELLGNQNGGVSMEDLKEILASIPKVQETFSNRQYQENIVEREDEDIKMDEDIIARINARTVEEIVKNTKVNSIKYKEKNEENTILNNVDELMDLL